MPFLFALLILRNSLRVFSMTFSAGTFSSPISRKTRFAVLPSSSGSQVKLLGWLRNLVADLKRLRSRKMKLALRALV